MTSTSAGMSKAMRPLKQRAAARYRLIEAVDLPRRGRGVKIEQILTKAAQVWGDITGTSGLTGESVTCRNCGPRRGALVNSPC
jgi:hypothetical protein